ncbi:glycosyltransferase [Pedobacter cryotolerans]|uniref:Streptomycin biosynthesis protein StrF domain-containing protein n=1 Tax=Pedobacter cryotolerans TaxID=2571270 RepID=A0A4U1CBH7_9SPHI|nr:glycosyltransferase [Pedobacter cryotolerans]TKC03262.1 hypothetical protein FA045_01445 [Pedobacter cryotolerans]
MISIIICSVSEEMLANVSLNIDETIGVPYEIIAYNNSTGNKGICEVYNNGANKAKFEILCFMHEDIAYRTSNWGKLLVDTFKKNTSIGVLGVVGSSYKSLAPSGWGADSNHGTTTFSNYIQCYKKSDKEKELIYNNPKGTSPAEVVVLDGLWLSTTRTIALARPFDEKLLEGFHCYDIDFCLNVGREYGVFVTYDILIEHFSEGSYDAKWLEDTLKIQNKWENILPKFVDNITNDEQYKIEKRAFKRFIVSLVESKKTYLEILSYLKKFKNSKVMSNALKYKLWYYVLKYKVESK